VIDTGRPPRVIPVIDLLGGLAVHAWGGRRSEYSPVASVLCEGADPARLLRAYRDRLGLANVYLADLDAIANGQPALALYREAAREGIRLLVDAGRSNPAAVRELFQAGAHSVVVATESLPAPRLIADLVSAVGADGLVFGLDLSAGVPLVAPDATWRDVEPEAMLDVALDAGIRRFLVLDLARVGSGSGLGLGAVGLASRFKARHAAIEVTVGGGVSGPDDLRRLAGLGIDAVLVGSALHDGRMGRSDCEGA
jgi:phosphoribosylformimino-5-aminoimidazole carboxamide ribotide isomerase